MQKLYTDLVGLPVSTEYSNVPIALLRDIIIDPENGKIVAFLVADGRVIVPMDVVNLHSRLIIADRDHVLPIDDVLRVKELFNRHIGLIGTAVFTERLKIYLGRVVDYEIDTRYMVLAKIHVAKIFLFFRFQESIIAHKSIVKIGKKKIVVKDSREAVEKQKATVRPEAFAA